MKSDTAIYQPLPLLPPPVGQSYLDPVFGTSIKRVTDARAANVWGCSSRYPTVSPFNCDDSLLLIEYGGTPRLHHSNGDYIGPLSVVAFEPVWSVSESSIIYYVVGNVLFRYNVRDAKTDILYRFDEYVLQDSNNSYGVRGLGEGDIFGDLMPLMGTRVDDETHDVFNFNLKTGEKGPVLHLGTNAPNSIYALPDRSMLLVYDDIGPGKYNGIWLYDSEFATGRQIVKAGGHLDIGTDQQGFTSMIWAVNAQPPDENPCGRSGGVAKVVLSNSETTCLLKLDLSYQATHTSCPTVPGWSIVSTYTPNVAAPWQPYTNEILRVSSDGLQILRLAHHRSRRIPGDNNYSWISMASVSRSGKRLVFNSNFGQGPPNYTDVYMIELEPASIPVTPVDIGVPIPGLYRPVSTSGLREGQEWDWRFKLVNGRIVFLGAFDRVDE